MKEGFNEVLPPENAPETPENKNEGRPELEPPYAVDIRESLNAVRGSLMEQKYEEARAALQRAREELNKLGDNEKAQMLIKFGKELQDLEQEIPAE